MIFEEEGQYKITVEKEKNRIFATFTGADKPANMPHYLDHVKKAISQVTKSYTLLAAITEETKNPSFAMTKLLKDSQKLFIDGGVSKTAVVVPPKKVFQRMTLNVVTKLSGMEIKVFPSSEEAEKWLNEEY